MKVYGIPNCNQVKLAKQWLEQAAISYEFIDIRKQPLTAELLSSWAHSLGWEKLVNRRGTTWRQLDPASQAQIVDTASAIAAILAKPTLMKRPVIVGPDLATPLIGYDPEHYQQILA